MKSYITSLGVNVLRKLDRHNRKNNRHIASSVTHRCASAICVIVGVDNALSLFEAKPLCKRVLTDYPVNPQELNQNLFLAATKQLYEWFSPSVRLSVCL